MLDAVRRHLEQQSEERLFPVAVVRSVIAVVGANQAHVGDEQASIATRLDFDAIGPAAAVLRDRLKEMTSYKHTPLRLPGTW